MLHLLSTLQNAVVLPDGKICDSSGGPTGCYVQPGGHQIFNARAQLIGTITLNGRIYDRDGVLIAQATRQDVGMQQA
jgi:hypothetical protein